METEDLWNKWGNVTGAAAVGTPYPRTIELNLHLLCFDIEEEMWWCDGEVRVKDHSVGANIEPWFLLALKMEIFWTRA
jgi:hypothetical protein